MNETNILVIDDEPGIREEDANGLSVRMVIMSKLPKMVNRV